MSNESEFLNLFEFIKNLQSLKSVMRATLATEERNENSAEHSWSVAMIAWLLSSELKKEFNEDIHVDKIIKMALMHDVVEIAVGDASVWDKEKRVEIEKQEENGFNILTATLPTELKNELVLLRTEFEEGKTLESKIVKGVDRLSAAIQRLVTKQGWVNEGHNEEDLDNIQLPKIAFSEVLGSVYSEIKKESFTKGLLEK